MATTRPEQPLASPLDYAVLCGFPCIVERLTVTHPRDVVAGGGVHAAPLNAVLDKRNLNVVRALLAHGVDIVNAMIEEGVSTSCGISWQKSRNGEIAIRISIRC